MIDQILALPEGVQIYLGGIVLFFCASMVFGLANPKISIARETIQNFFGAVAWPLMLFIVLLAGLNDE